MVENWWVLDDIASLSNPVDVERRLRLGHDVRRPGCVVHAVAVDQGGDVAETRL